MDVPVFSESDSTPEPDYLTKIIQQLVHALRYCIGLQIPPVSTHAQIIELCELCYNIILIKVNSRLINYYYLQTLSS